MCRAVRFGGAGNHFVDRTRKRGPRGILSRLCSQSTWQFHLAAFSKALYLLVDLSERLIIPSDLGSIEIVVTARRIYGAINYLGYQPFENYFNTLPERMPSVPTVRYKRR